MKYITLVILASLSTSFSIAEDKDTHPKKKKTKVSKVSTPSEKKADANKPCDSKEDVLKKLEEKKKAQAAVEKAFSLQGGNTGCSTK